MESITISQDIVNAVAAIKQAEKVFQLTTSWREQVGAEVRCGVESEEGCQDGLFLIAEKAVTQVMTEIMRRQVALYKELEGLPLSYDDVMNVVVGEQGVVCG